MNSQPFSFSGLIHKKSVRLLLIVLLCAIMTAILSGASLAKYEMIITDEDKTAVVFTSTNDPYDVLSQAGITLDENDTIEYSGVENSNQGTITVIRGKIVKIVADGQFECVYVTGGTIADALEKANITLGDDDKISVSPNEKVIEDTEVTINRITYKDVKYEETIPYTVVERRTRNLADGKRVTETEGKDGVLTTYSRQTLMDGVVISEEISEQKVTKSAVNASVLVGDSSAPASQLTPTIDIEFDANGNPTNYKYKVTGKATAYSALGRPTTLVPGCVAMNLSKFPRGTRLYIKTRDGSYVYGYSEVRDTGIAVNDGRVLVDCFFNTYRESCLFGAKVVDVYVF